MKKSQNFLAIFAVVFLILTPNKSWACACGCSMFDVGTASTLPTQVGGLAFLEYNNVNQNKNWHQTGRGNMADSHDRKIVTETYTAGLQYMFNRRWGLMTKIPYVERRAQMAGAGHHHNLGVADNKFSHNSIGDVKLMGIYSGFSPNMSTGLIFGVKLPTGTTNHNDFEADMQIGTGSTDAIIGAYHMGQISKDGSWNYFMQGTWQKAITTKQNYFPGTEYSASSGLYYDFGQVGIFSKFAPMLQIIASDKNRDRGSASNSENSGYFRTFIAPGLQVNIDQVRIYSDIQFPVYQNLNGNQLAVSKIFKLVIGYKF